MNCIHLIFSDWSSPGVFAFKNAAILIKQLIPLVNRNFFGASRPNTERNLHCTVTADVETTARI
jgi:hypothetical protein